MYFMLERLKKWVSDLQKTSLNMSMNNKNRKCFLMLNVKFLFAESKIKYISE